MKIFVVGSPRSGTSYLTEYIGKHTDHCLNEPWDRYPQSKIEDWNLPKGSLVFKYCSNSLYYDEISNKFPEARWVNIKRNPLHVVYSMSFPKNNWPIRTWEELGEIAEERILNAFYKWSLLSSAADRIKTALVLKYENIDIDLLSKFAGINFDKDQHRNSFRNKNFDFQKDNMDLLVDVLIKNNIYEMVTSNQLD